MVLVKVTSSFFGETLTSTELKKILEDVEAFLGKPFTLLELQKEKDAPHGRIDLWVTYEGIFTQKLLIMDGEVIDGETFHKRFEEWYPRRVKTGAIAQ